jgi:hypothetical protein
VEHAPGADHAAPDLGTDVGEAPASVGLAGKLDLYAQCLSRSRRPIEGALARWSQRIGDDGRPRRKDIVPHLDEIGAELAPCRHAVDAAGAAAPPRPELDDSLREYLERAEPLATLSHDLHAYYRDEGFAKDDWADGVRWAGQLAAAEAAWTPAAQRFERALADEFDVVDAERLARAESAASGGLQHRTLAAFHDAKLLGRCIAATTSPRGSTCAAELAAARATAETFAQAYAATRDPGRDPGDEVFWMAAFDASLGRFMERATAWVEPGPGRRKPDDDEAATSAVDAAYATLERDARQLDFEFPS